MAPIFSLLLALASTGAATYATSTQPMSNNTLITYTKTGCYNAGCGFVYHDFQPNTCAVTITQSGLNISEAIAEEKTLVKSGLLMRHETGYVNPVFVAWDEGPESNADGLLQCGTAKDSEVVKGQELCISAPDNGNYHGYSYYRPEVEVEVEVNVDIPTCTNKQHPDAVMISGKIYTIAGIPDDDKAALLSLVLNGGGIVSVDLEIYLTD